MGILCNVLFIKAPSSCSQNSSMHSRKVYDYSKIIRKRSVIEIGLSPTVCEIHVLSVCKWYICVRQRDDLTKASVGGC